VWGVSRESAAPPVAAPVAAAPAPPAPAPDPAPLVRPDPAPPAAEPPGDRTAAALPAAEPDRAPDPRPEAVVGRAVPDGGTTRRPAAAEVTRPTVVATKGIRDTRPGLTVIPVPRAASGEGVLAISATPWAIVTVDGKEIGETPVELRVGGGTYRVRATHPDFAPREQSVSVTPGKRRLLNVTFTR
jgi:hypothetical protein